MPLKSQRLLRLEATIVDCYEFIEAQKANYSIAMMCRVLQVSRASFYRWCQPKQPSPRQVRHQQLVAAVKAEYEDAEGMAGRRQLTRLLNTKGIEVSESTVGAIMRVHDLRAIRTMAWKQTTVQDPQARTEHIDNHMIDDHGDRDFSSETPGTRLVGDITYLKTGQGWLYLATVIDLCTGMVIGWNTANHMRTDLCIGALAMARDQGYLHPDQAIYHTDRGAQFTSAQFQ
ncbi:IS3 family transposase, partial [Enteractinococcus helveticum]|uniref:IS3 family transposase n=1 Tax=Enteractinococcus helveticum TaxID=1837282 RepID=UPI001F48CAC9